LNILTEITANSLQWMPELGIGYYPVTESPYDADYFERYQGMADTKIGKALNDARLALVAKYENGTVLDIGIGSGAFVESRPKTWGYDINPVALQWLFERKRYRHPFRGADSVTFWDSLEHIHNPSLVLAAAKRFVFVSCPIYNGLDHLLGSRHYRKDEHCWYWTTAGLIEFMGRFGFGLLEMNRMESEIGREDIGSFVFKRMPAA
jgi:hypothetical protein